MFKDRSLAHLPISTWLSSKDAIVGLLLSSFVINLLGLVFPICVLQFYDRVIPHRSVSTLVAMVMLIIGALAFEVALKILRGYVSAWASARFTYNTGKTLFDKIIYADLEAIKQKTAGEYLDEYNSAESLRDHYCGQNLIMIVDLPFIFLYLGLIFFINKYLALVPLSVIVVMFAVSINIGRRGVSRLEQKTDLSEIKSKFLIEVISGIHTIKSMGMEEQFLRRYERVHEREISNNYELIQRTSESSQSGNLFSQLTLILTVCAGGILVIKQAMSVGGLAASILLVGKAIAPVTKFASYIEKNRNLDIAREDMESLLDLKREYAPDARKLEQIKGELELRNISYKYENADQYVLKDINFKIEANEIVALHGAGFSGKTTLFMIMDSLLKPTEGEVLVDGINLATVDLENYRRRVGFMSEHGELFAGTILENLTMFEPEKYATKAKALAKVLGLHDIIETMPNAYATEVGTGTVDLLSRGQKQLILIVRALLDDPQIIIFDEANRSLDIDSDQKMLKYLTSLKGNRTIIMVSYRPSYLAIAQKHYKMEHNRLLEFQWK